MERLTRVTVIAILQIIFAVFGIIASLLGILAGGLIGGLSGSAEGAAAGGLLAGLFVIFLVLGIASLVLAIGLLQLKGWVWIGTLIVQGIGILVGLLQIMHGDFTSGLSIVLSGVFIAVLLQPDAKHAFGH